MATAICPGTFDPITMGHLDIIARSSEIFDKVIVAILNNASKTPLFTAVERREQISGVISGFDNVEVDVFDGLLVDFVKSKRASVIVKGLRTVADFEYEFVI